MALLVLRSAPSVSLEQVRTADPAPNPPTELRAISDILQQQPDNQQTLGRLDSLYDGLCDPTTQEPTISGAGAVLRRIVRTLQDGQTGRPDTGPREVRIGRFALAAGMDTDAATALTRATTLGVDPDSVVVPLALALLRADRPEELLQRLQPDAVADPHRRVLLQVLRARAQIALGHYDVAREGLQTALNAEPNNVGVLARFGVLVLWHDGGAEAASIVARARALNPDAPPTLQLAAEYAYATSDFAGSADTYGRLVQRGVPEVFDPIPPALGEARALIYRGDLKAAAAVLDAAPLDPADPTRIYYRALLAFRSGAYRLAGELAEPLDAKLRDFAPLDLLVGGSMLANGFPEIAAYRLRRYLQAVPDNAAARSLLNAAEARLAHPDATAELPRAPLLAAFGFAPLPTSAASGNLTMPPLASPPPTPLATVGRY